MKSNRVLPILALCLISILGICAFGPNLLVWTWHQYWQDVVAQKKLYAVHSAYPGAVVVDNVTSFRQWSAGNNVTMHDITTFQTSDTWDTVKDWYAKHPDGSVCTYGYETGYGICRLALVDNTSGKVVYQVQYDDTFECDDVVCIDTPTP